MMKWFVVVCLILGIVGAALAEEFTTERIPMTILGQPAMMVRTVRQGGPLKGFFGNNAQAQSTYGLNAKGELVCLSTTQSNGDGLGKAMLQGVPQAAMLGGMQIIAAGQIRPDSTTVNVPVKTNVRTNASARSSSDNTNVNVNSNFQQQQQQQTSRINGNQGGGNDD